MCMCNFACKGRPRNDLYCVGRDVKPYSLTHWLLPWPGPRRPHANIGRGNAGLKVRNHPCMSAAFRNSDVVG